MVEWLGLVWFFVTHPGLLLFALALSGTLGFWIVQSLVVWYDWTNETMNLLSPDYIWFWLLIATGFSIFFGVPLYGIWIEFRRWRQANQGK